MSQMLLLAGNPTKKRRSGKHRTAAQKAATRRMIAANRARRNPAKSPAAKKARRRSAAAPRARHHARRALTAFRASGFVPMMKRGAMLGAGAVAGDVLFGFASRFLPASMATPMTQDGTNQTQWGYFAAKLVLTTGAALALRKHTRFANDIGEGSAAVMAYTIMRGLIPAGTIPMGAYMNPVPVSAPPRSLGGPRSVGGGMGGVGAYMSVGARVAPVQNLRGN